jgi:hypothetical protein
MRTYLAILKDSFREALASRVMLVTLIGIVVVLALLAPFGLDVSTSTELRRSELANPERLLKRFSEQLDQPQTPSGHLWSLMDTRQQAVIERLLNPDEGDKPPPRHRGPDRLKRQLVEQLNDLLVEPNFYKADVWADVELNDEATELVQQADLVELDQKRRNLLLLASAFPRSIDIVDSHAFSLVYGTAVVQGPIPLTPTQFEPIFDQILVGVVSTFLGFFGVFGCLLVTAGLIPRTFEPGEIALLLSKPVNRSLLFVVKFFGGCTFTLLYSTVLVLGIWLMLGLRMDYWRHGLLWCIPVYVFLFMIYYAVSAVAGAIWRNSIVALALVVVFWLAVTVIGVTQDALKQNLIDQRGIKEIVSAGSELLTVDGQHNTWVWDDASSAWREVFKEPPGGMGALGRLLFGTNFRFIPVYDSTNDRILAVQQTQSRFGGFGAAELISGSADDDWERVSLGQIPDQVSTVLIRRDGRVILPGRRAIYEFIGQTQEEQQRSEFFGRISGGLLGSSNKAFQKIEIESLPENEDGFAVAMDPLTDDIWLLNAGRLQCLKAADDGTYSVENSKELESDSTGVLAVAGSRLILGIPDGSLQAFDTQTLELIDSWQLDPNDQASICVAAANGTALAAHTENNTVVLFDIQSDEFREWASPNSDMSSAISFNPEGHLLTGNGRLMVAEYNQSEEGADSVRKWSEATTWVYQLYDYAIVPAWTVLPKPAQLDDCVQYVLAQDTVTLAPAREPGSSGINPNDVRTPDSSFNIWPVLRDNAIFVFVMLSIGCIYISRRDF